ncbi:NAD(+) diphosphatase [Litorilituus lipolyticus]|uniref:NAD(+) diphosphatase n=1 Tax=Litorilituus lipolyticus TaxID=2491017 RepID=A0A502KM19_9GAMM|nr:NAD(+) diphosphatase [Litorilituus lipolyticus]TPH12496.1 NAD(+) diphosphatase [Litorilituus lipolyticus]
MSLTYSLMPLDRCSNQRKNLSWLKKEFSHQDTVFCLINDGMSFFNLEGSLTPYFVPKQLLVELTVHQCIYLGKGKRGSVFAVDYNNLRFSTQQALESLGGWQVLREVTAVLNSDDAATLALAKGLVHWHKSHQFCGQCGNVNRSTEAGHARKCTECRNLTFPRTDPAVIMLVEKMFADGIPRCLLGRQASWPEGMYSTLAGFVDPGESLEEAVIREVKEEANIDVEKPKYVASQPWPFPASIMLGFVAVATSEKIDVSQDSLENAQWFSREQLASFKVNERVINTEQLNSPSNSTNVDKNSASSIQYKMSSQDSISSHLIKAWLNKEIGIYL